MSAKILITTDGEQIRGSYHNSQEGFETALSNSIYSNSAVLALGFDAGQDVGLAYAPPAEPTHLHTKADDAYAVFSVKDLGVSDEAYEVAVTFIIEDAD